MLTSVAWKAAVGAATTAMFLTGWVEGFFFYPDARTWSTPAQFGVTAQDVELRAVDGSRLHAWWLPVPAGVAAKGSVLHLHGNAANVSNHLPLVAWLPANGFNVLMLDYRGFGRSEGKPSLAGVVDDAAVALEHLRTRPDVDATRLIVFGQSLGGATALRLLARDSTGVRLGIIEAAFSGYRTIARDAAGGSVLAPVLPFVIGSLPGTADDPLAALAKIPVPLIFIHGTDDRVIPIAHSDALHAAAGPNAQFWRVPGGEHLVMLSGEWRGRLLAAMRDAVR